MQYIGIIELENGDYYDVCKVESDGKSHIEAGACTNTGFLSYYGIDYDDDLTQIENIERLYNHIIECKLEDEDVRKLLADY